MDMKWLSEQVEKGRTDVDISTECGVEPWMVAYYRRTGLKVVRLPTRTKWDVDPQWLLEQVEAGKSDKDIAAEKNMTVSAVGQYRRRFKIPPRPASVRATEAIKAKFPNGRKGELAGNWRGGRRSSTGQKPGGYIRLYMPEHPSATKGYVYEHRYVMEQKLGRLLEPGELVDHIDRNRSNNAPENLRLQASRSAHVKDHFSARDQLTEAMKVIARYKALYGPLPE